MTALQELAEKHCALEKETFPGVTHYLLTINQIEALIKEVLGEPYAYEFGKDNGDGTYSITFSRGELEQVSPREYKYAEPKGYVREHPPKALYAPKVKL